MYEGSSLAPAVYPCGATWTTLSVLVHSPPANATQNGTALQLRLAAPQTARGWGATVWLGAVTVVEVVEVVVEAVTVVEVAAATNAA